LKTKTYDVIIIGAGPIGLACGIKAQKAGLSYTILDKGCLVNSIYNYPNNMTFFSTSEKLEIGLVPFISHQPKPNRQEALEYYRRVCTSWNLQVKLYEKVTDLKLKDSLHNVTTEKDTYTCKFLILALGF
jgi:thioredoxin reductase (NADPH)